MQGISLENLNAENVFNQNMAGVQMENANATLAREQEAARIAADNSALSTQFTQGVDAAGFDNNLRTQELEEALMLRNLPLNELNALRSGEQVNMPQFSDYYTNNAEAAPVFDASVAQGTYDMNAYQQRQSGYNALLSSLGRLGAAAI